jgi:hypothetical protein
MDTSNTGALQQRYSSVSVKQRATAGNKTTTTVRGQHYFRRHLW